MQSGDGTNLNHELQELRRQNADLRTENARLRGPVAAATPTAHSRPLLSSECEDLILESATGYAILSMDADGLITSWNEGARLIHGWTEGEVQGQHTRLIFTPEDQKAGTAEEEMRIAASRGSAENERWHMRKDGTRFYAAGLLMPLRDGSGG